MAGDSKDYTDPISLRLDALDRALLDILPRGERIALVADIEIRLLDRLRSDPQSLEALALGGDGSSASTRLAGQSALRPRRRSRLAVSAGILGIIAVGLMLLMPVSYIVIASIAEMIGEYPSIGLLIAHVLMVTGGGLVALVMAAAALIRLSRSKNTKRGAGWAITGLCTSPLPALMGLLATLFFVVPVVFEFANNTDNAGPQYVASMPVSIESAPICDGPCPPMAPMSGYASTSGNPYAPPPPVAPTAVSPATWKAAPPSTNRSEPMAPPLELLQPAPTYVQELDPLDLP